MDSSDARDPGSGKRLTPRELLELVHPRAGTTSRRSVLLVVHMHRSDKLQALSQQPYAREVLGEVARRVQGMLRHDDRYAFATPDEFWVLLQDLPSEALGELAARTLRENLLRPVPVRRDGVSASTVHMRPVIGGAWTRDAANADPMTLLTSASDAASRARSSDDHVLIVRMDSDSARVDRDAFERDLRAALHANELDVHFQPQVDLGSGRCVAAEALVRWTRADGKSVSPALIASVAEERGLMGPLTQFVLNTSLRNVAFWKSGGIDLSVGINLSAVTLADTTFPAMVGQALATWGVPGEKLTLELTESAIVQNELSAIDFMKQLKANGCKLAIDDFGTDYSSFSYLRKFPLDELKIDQSFVRSMLSDRGDRQIVRALVDLAHTFEMHALAEGVEIDAVAQLLGKLGCDRAQGYLYSKAIAARALPDWVRAFNAQAAGPGQAPAEAALAR